MKHRCVCCGNLTIDDSDPIGYEICPVCFWENDPMQNENPDHRGGANRIFLNETHENHKKYGACDRESVPFVRKPYEKEKTDPQK